MAETHLHIHLPRAKEGSAPHIFHLESSGLSFASETLTFTCNTIIYDGDATIYRGPLLGARDTEVKAVCKLAWRTEETMRSFHREAEVYQEKLRDLQGRYIPLFYGLYVGSVMSESMICILLEDCGSSVPEMFDLSMEWRIELMKIYMAIHKRNIQLNDWGSMNVVVDNLENPQRLVVVDFERAKDHVCKRERDIALYCLPPWQGSFQCNELYNMAERMEIWTPNTIRFQGGYVSVHSIKSPEDLVRIAPKRGGRYKPEDVLEAAKHTIQQQREQYKYRLPYLRGEEYHALEPIM